MIVAQNSASISCSNLKQMVGHVESEIEQQDPENAIWPPPLLLILGYLQFPHQVWSYEQRFPQPTILSGYETFPLKIDGQEGAAPRLTWTLHSASEQVAAGGGAGGDQLASSGDGVKAVAREGEGRRGREGFRECSGRRGEEQQQLRHRRCSSHWVLVAWVLGEDGWFRSSRARFQRKVLVLAVWCRLRTSHFCFI